MHVRCTLFLPANQAEVSAVNLLAFFALAFLLLTLVLAGCSTETESESERAKCVDVAGDVAGDELAHGYMAPEHAHRPPPAPPPPVPTPPPPRGCVNCPR